MGVFGDMVYRQNVAGITSRMILGKPVGYHWMLIDMQTLAIVTRDPARAAAVILFLINAGEKTCAEL